MKRDLDLIRGILLAVENRSDYPAFNDVKDIASQMNVTDLQLMSFHISLLADCNYIDFEDCSCLGQGYQDYAIYRLTQDGCNYIDTIRNEEIWSLTKKKLITIGGSASLFLVKTIAEKFIQANS